MTDDATSVAAAEPSQPVADTATPNTAYEATPADAIDRAFAALDRDEAGDASPAPETGRERNPDGTFRAKDVAPDAGEGDTAETVEDERAPETESKFVEAPSRFSADAKTAWAAAPEPVKAEIHRAVRELEAGIEQYRQRWEPLKPFDDLARQSNTSIEAALTNYIGIEQLIARDPIAGFERVAQNMGLSLRDIAAHVMGQAPDAVASQQDATIRELRGELAALRQELGGVTTSIRSDKEQAVFRQIEDFAKTAPRFDDLASDVAFFIESGRANDLKEAYALAERLNPVPQPASTPAASAAPETIAAQNRKGRLSLSGSPGAGSSPTARPVSESPLKAVDAAFAALGING